jgi:septal ring factor EnvC (AmiA/AmiB activator)
MADLESRLAKINGTIQALRARIQDENKKELTLLSQLDRLAFNRKLIKTEIDLYSVQQEKISQELTTIKNNIADFREKLRREQLATETTLVTLYKYGKFDFLQFLLEAENMSALFSESKNLTFLARYEQKVIADYLKTISDLKTAEKAQETKRAEYAQSIQKADQKKKELEAQEVANKALLQQIQKNIKTFQQALQEQSERAQSLQSLMDKLASQEIVLPFRFVPFYEMRGRLPWPIAGKIITRFGPEKYLNTMTMNNGVEISPNKNNTDILCIHAGKVVYADYFQGYGNLLIIDHGLNYYSLYGHCADFKVDKGDFVREGQSIAEVGDSGSLKGVCLYLEIRYKTKPLDPLQWLKRR